MFNSKNPISFTVVALCLTITTLTPTCQVHADELADITTSCKKALTDYGKALYTLGQTKDAAVKTAIADILEIDFNHISAPGPSGSDSSYSFDSNFNHAALAERVNFLRGEYNISAPKSKAGKAVHKSITNDLTENLINEFIDSCSKLNELSREINELAQVMFEAATAAAPNLNELALVNNVWAQVPDSSSKKRFAGGVSLTFSHFVKGLNGLLVSAQAEGHFQTKKFDLGIAFNYGMIKSKVTHKITEASAEFKNHLFSGLVNLGYYDFDGARGGVNLGGGLNLSSGEEAEKRIILFTGANLGWNFNLSSLVTKSGVQLEILPEVKGSFAFAFGILKEGQNYLPQHEIFIYSKLLGGVKLTVGKKQIAKSLDFNVHLPVYAGINYSRDMTPGPNGKGAKPSFTMKTGLHFSFTYKHFVTGTIGYNFDYSPKFITNSGLVRVMFSF